MADPKDYHGQQNYIVILGIIAVLLALMIGASATHMSPVIIAVLGTIQFYLVLSNLMHMKYEPTLLKLTVYISIFFVVLFFFGTAPDTLRIPLVIEPQ